MENNTTFDNNVQELRRGVIVLAVLSELQAEQYGYSILKDLSEKGLEVDQGTLYPLLRRLETQALLESKWRLEESHPRRYYVLSEKGKQMLTLLRAEWEKMACIMEKMLAEKKGE